MFDVSAREVQSRPCRIESSTAPAPASYAMNQICLKVCVKEAFQIQNRSFGVATASAVLISFAVDLDPAHAEIFT